MPENKENKSEEIEALDRELEDEIGRLKKMPTHGSHMGGNEFQDMRQNHPALLEFFANADEVLELSGEVRERLTYLENRCIDGEITQDEFKELVETFFNPYCAKKLAREA